MIALRTAIVLNVLLSIGAAQLNAADVDSIMDNYIRYLIDGDYKSAESLWHPQYIETCYRLGITYADTPFKFDCVSPLLENIDLIRSGSATWQAVSTGLDPNHQKVVVRITSGSNTVSCDYYFAEDSTGTFMIPRFWMYLNNFDLVETKYFNVYYRSREQLNDFAIYDLDRFVETVAETFDVSPKKLLELSHERMEYFLLDSESEVAELLGFPSQGTYYTPCDVIISRRIPDYHEVAMFLLDYMQPEHGLYVEPFISRGIACYLGGRFGQTKDVMWQVANFTLQNDIFELSDILTFDGFRNKIGNIDFSFPLSLGLVSALEKRIGMSGVLGLFADLSGTVDDVNNWSAEDVESKLTKSVNMSWDQIVAATRAEVADDPFPNLKPGITSDTGIVAFESGTSDYHIRITLDDGWYNVVVTPFLVGSIPEGSIVLSGYTGNQMVSFKSFLWNDQFPDKGYSSEIYAIRFNGQEVGVYDYLINELIAKYVASFDKDSDLVGDGCIKFRLRENTLRDRLDQFKCRLDNAGS